MHRYGCIIRFKITVVLSHKIFISQATFFRYVFYWIAYCDANAINRFTPSLMMAELWMIKLFFCAKTYLGPHDMHFYPISEISIRECFGVLPGVYIFRPMFFMGFFWPDILEFTKIVCFFRLVITLTASIIWINKHVTGLAP